MGLALHVVHEVDQLKFEITCSVSLSPIIFPDCDNSAQRYCGRDGLMVTARARDVDGGDHDSVGIATLGGASCNTGSRYLLGLLLYL